MLHCTFRWLYLCTAFATLTFTSTANAWSIFGPANFEDCVLQNMKGVSSDGAAALIRGACRKKFPQNDVQPSPAANIRAGYPRIDVWDQINTAKIFPNIKIGSPKYNQYNAYEIPITNKTNIKVAGIYIGIPASQKAGPCPSNKSDFTEIYECSVDINPNTTKTAFCTMPRVTFCLSGIWAAYEVDVDKFFREIAP